MTSQDLVPGINPKDLLQNRDQILATVRHGLETLMLANEQGEKAGFHHVWLDLVQTIFYCDRNLNQVSTDSVMKAFGAKLDTTGWSRLLHASGLRTFMDTQAREQWDAAIRKNDTPPLEAVAIECTFRKIHSERSLMVERGVLAVFQRLSWKRKSNQPSRFGKKIIVQGFLDRYGFISTGAGGLDDLIRAFCIFDGVPEPDHRTSITNGRGQGGGEWSNDYIHLKWFKNSNAHVTFKRPDLVDKLNAVLAKHYPGALPAPQ